MQMPVPSWTTTYSASRRKHHHRCWCCNRIIKDGETIVMARIRHDKTKCAHAACSERKSTTPGGFDYTAADLMQAWGMEHLAALGFADAKAFRATSPLCRVGG